MGGSGGTGGSELEGQCPLLLQWAEELALGRHANLSRVSHVLLLERSIPHFLKVRCLLVPSPPRFCAGCFDPVRLTSVWQRRKMRDFVLGVLVSIWCLAAATAAVGSPEWAWRATGRVATVDLQPYPGSSYVAHGQLTVREYMAYPLWVRRYNPAATPELSREGTSASELRSAAHDAIFPLGHFAPSSFAARSHAYLSTLNVTVLRSPCASRAS